MFIVVGTNYKYCPIEIRERLSIPKGKLKDALAELTNNKGIKGAVILSTCNRIEVYASVDDINEGITVGARSFGYAQDRFIAPVYNGFDKSNPYVYTYTGREAVYHLFEVSCGLDSQIIGEGQIPGQVEFAWQEAKRIEATDRVMDAIFEKAMRIAYEVKEKTGISTGNISIADIVLGLINTNFGGLRGKRILIIGVGKISELIVKQLKKRQASAVFIANKTFEKARQLADTINAEVVRFDRLREKLKEADVVISATASPHYILKKEDIGAVIASEPRRGERSNLLRAARLLIIDLAIPRDVEPSVKEIDGVTLFNLDDLNPVIERHLGRRIQEIPRARDIINKEVENLCLTGNLELEPEEALLP